MLTIEYMLFDFLIIFHNNNAKLNCENNIQSRTTVSCLHDVKMACSRAKKDAPLWRMTGFGFFKPLRVLIIIIDHFLSIHASSSSLWNIGVVNVIVWSWSWLLDLGTGKRFFFPR
jgi:hypothetical protein